MPDWHWVPIQPGQHNPASCGATRGHRGRVRCELPRDHVVGRERVPMTYEQHLGRTRTGAWVQWDRTYKRNETDE